MVHLEWLHRFATFTFFFHTSNFWFPLPKMEFLLSHTPVRDRWLETPLLRTTTHMPELPLLGSSHQALSTLAGSRPRRFGSSRKGPTRILMQVHSHSLNRHLLPLLLLLSGLGF